MLTGTLVTAIGFLPIGLANSAVGEYAGGIFWVVGIALVASWFVAVIFTPYLGVKLLPNVARKAHHADPNAVYNGRFYRAFRRVLEFCVRRPLIVIAVTVTFLGLGLSGFSHVQQQFFPLVGAARIVSRNADGRGHLDRGDVQGRARGRAIARRRRRCGVLHDLYRQGLAALLARPAAGAAQ